jgi:hypothetical protein
LVGLPTLHAILAVHGIKSNQNQKKYNFLCKSLTHSKLHKIHEYIYEKTLESQLKSLSSKSNSEWSKSNVTLVLDASVFKNYLSQNPDSDDFYGKWFSGQYHSVVFGFKILTLGVVIDHFFYPLYYEFVSKKPDSEKTISGQLLTKFHLFWQNFQKKHENLPEKLHLSCDNGYSCKEMVESCEKNKLILLSVPKKNNIFKIENTSASLKHWIETEYLIREKLFLKEQELDKVPPNQQKAFTWRIKAHYKSFGIEVILLFFRYNKSDKVTVIYCPVSHSPHIFAKSMRHHWFARTQIEQFFRTVKHILKIQEAKSQNKIEMDLKVGRFFELALEGQFFVLHIRKKIKQFKNLGLKQIIKHIIFNLNKMALLEDLLFN